MYFAQKFFNATGELEFLSDKKLMYLGKSSYSSKSSQTLTFSTQGSDQRMQARRCV